MIVTQTVVLSNDLLFYIICMYGSSFRVLCTLMFPKYRRFKYKMLACVVITTTMFLSTAEKNSSTCTRAVISISLYVSADDYI